MPTNRLGGKLIAVHGTSPAFLQRAAVVAFLSILFFFSTLICFYLFKMLVLFLLSSAFLILYIFTMIGWWLQKKNAVNIYESGLTYKNTSLRWDDIAGSKMQDNGSLSISAKDGSSFTIPTSVAATDRIHAFIIERLT